MSHEDGPSNTTPAERTTMAPEEYSASEEITQVETPVPQRTTLSPQDADRLMVQQALLRVATYGDVLERIEKKLDEQVVKSEAFDRGIGALIRANERLDVKLDRLRADLQLWLFGDSHRNGIAQEVGLARVRIDSLFPMVEKAIRGIEQTYDAALNTNGLEHESAGEQSDPASGSGRPNR